MEPNRLELSKVMLLVVALLGVTKIGLAQPPNGTLTLSVEKFRLLRGCIIVTVVVPVLAV